MVIKDRISTTSQSCLHRTHLPTLSELHASNVHRPRSVRGLDDLKGDFLADFRSRSDYSISTKQDVLLRVFGRDEPIPALGIHVLNGSLCQYSLAHTPPSRFQCVPLPHAGIAGDEKQFKRPRCGKENTQINALPHSHMGTVYQRCPFCDRVFEIGPADYRPMKRHIRIKHAQQDDGSNSEPTPAPPVAPRTSL